MTINGKDHVPTWISSARTLCAVLLVSLCSAGVGYALTADSASGRDPWFSTSENGQTRIDLYFFWSLTCPHCSRARPFIESLPQSLPWLDLHSYEVTSRPENAQHYVHLAQSVGQEARSVPAFLFCGTMLTGYDDDARMGAYIKDRLAECYKAKEGDGLTARGVDSEAEDLHVPLIGTLTPGSWSLPVLTVMLAGLDSFNPCAFFVLLFLLSLLVHARSRSRMLLIGTTFVAVSGLVYFASMAVWLNLFLYVGQLRWITAAAGLFAVLIAVINVKDYFWFRRGVSLTIPDTGKPRLFQRMRRLLGTERMPTLIAATMVLAVVANAYELLCTAGFPMVFTRVLTLNELSPSAYYLYLLGYNIVYVIPLLLIVLLFVWTLGARKLTEGEGRSLKLLSGLMMLGLGSLLIFAPEALTQASVSAGLLAGAVVATFLISTLRPV